MKRIVTIVAIILFQMQVFAGGWNKGMLRIKEENGRTISVTIDGKRVNKMGHSLTVNDIDAGKHLLKIYKYNVNGHGYSTGILIYEGDVMIKPGRIYYCTISKGNMDIEENCCMDDYGKWNNNDNWDKWDDNYENNDRSWNNNKRWDKNNNNNFDDNSWDSYTGVMSDGRFQLLIEQVRKASFESSKVNVAKSALQNNQLTVNQLILILNEFSFESTKLQFAKDNYRNVVDRKNFFMVNDVFTFQSSKDDLSDFLNRTQR